MQILPAMDLLALHSHHVWTALLTDSLPERAGVSLRRVGESLRVNRHWLRKPDGLCQFLSAEVETLSLVSLVRSQQADQAASAQAPL